MKKSLFYVLLLLMVASIMSCRPSTESPEKVIEGWLTHMTANNIDKAMELSTLESQELLKAWKAEDFNFYAGGVVENLTVELLSDTVASGSFMLNGELSELQAVKKEGKWKVQLVK